MYGQRPDQRGIASGITSTENLMSGVFSDLIGLILEKGSRAPEKDNSIMRTTRYVGIEGSYLYLNSGSLNVPSFLITHWSSHAVKSKLIHSVSGQNYYHHLGICGVVPVNMHTSADYHPYPKVLTYCPPPYFWETKHCLSPIGRLAYDNMKDVTAVPNHIRFKAYDQYPNKR